MSGNPKSSPWRSTPRARRGRPGVQLTLSPKALAKLERLADGGSRSAVIESLISKEGHTMWTFEGYWNTVLGANRNATDVVRELELDPSDARGLDEWLGKAESEAWTVGGFAGQPYPEEWTGYHARALEALVEAAS